MLWKEGGYKPERPSTAAGLCRTMQWKTTLRWLFILLWRLIPGLAAWWTFFLVRRGDQLSLPVFSASAEQLEKEKRKSVEINSTTGWHSQSMASSLLIERYPSIKVPSSSSLWIPSVLLFVSQKVTQSNSLLTLQVKCSHAAYPSTSTVFSINKRYRCKSFFIHKKNSVTMNVWIYDAAAIQLFWNIVCYLVVEHISSISVLLLVSRHTDCK